MKHISVVHDVYCESVGGTVPSWLYGCAGENEQNRSAEPSSLLLHEEWQYLSSFNLQITVKRDFLCNLITRIIDKYGFCYQQLVESK